MHAVAGEYPAHFLLAKLDGEDITAYEANDQEGWVIVRDVDCGHVSHPREVCKKQVYGKIEIYIMPESKLTNDLRAFIQHLLDDPEYCKQWQHDWRLYLREVQQKGSDHGRPNR